MSGKTFVFMYDLRAFLSIDFQSMLAWAGAVGATGLAASPGLVVPMGTAAPPAGLVASGGLVAPAPLGGVAGVRGAAGLGAGEPWAWATDRETSDKPKASDSLRTAISGNSM